MKKLYGIICIVISSIGFGIMPVLVKSVYELGGDTISVIFYKSLFGSVMLWIFNLITKKPIKLSKDQLKFIIVVGLIGYYPTSFALFEAYNYMPAGAVTTIHFIYPAIVTTVSYFLYKENITLLKAIALFLSFFGVFMIVGVGGNISFDVMGVIFSIASAITWTIYVLGIANPLIKDIESSILAFYLSVISTIITIGAQPIIGNINVIIPIKAIIMMVFLTLSSTIIPLVAFGMGVQIIGPGNASILSTLELVTSFIAAYLVLGEGVTWQMIIGALLIISAIILLSVQKDEKDESLYLSEKE